MPKHEKQHGETPANQNQIGDLFNKSEAWLKNNGQLVIENYGDSDQPAAILGQYEGLPVTDGMPHVVVEVSGDSVRKQLPDAAEALQLGETLSVIHWLPHYSSPSRSGRHHLAQSEVSFTISKAEGLATASDRIVIGKNVESGKWESSRDNEDDSAPIRGQIEPDALVKGVVADWAKQGWYEDAAKAGPLTEAEYKALSAVVENLDELTKYAAEA